MLDAFVSLMTKQRRVNGRRRRGLKMQREQHRDSYRGTNINNDRMKIEITEYPRLADIYISIECCDSVYVLVYLLNHKVAVTYQDYLLYCEAITCCHTV